MLSQLNFVILTIVVFADQFHCLLVIPTLPTNKAWANNTLCSDSYDTIHGNFICDVEICYQRKSGMVTVYRSVCERLPDRDVAKENMINLFNIVTFPARSTLRFFFWDTFIVWGCHAFLDYMFPFD